MFRKLVRRFTSAFKPLSSEDKQKLYNTGARLGGTVCFYFESDHPPQYAASPKLFQEWAILNIFLGTMAVTNSFDEESVPIVLEGYQRYVDLWMNPRSDIDELLDLGAQRFGHYAKCENTSRLATSFSLYAKTGLEYVAVLATINKNLTVYREIAVKGPD